MKRKVKVFRSGGSLAVRIPKAWIGETEHLVLSRKGNDIILSPEGDDLRALARKFAADGLIAMKRPEQPATPSTRWS